MTAESLESSIKEIISREIGARLLHMKNLSLGWSGSSVYEAEVDGGRYGKRLIVKTSPSEYEPNFNEESDSSRVYGGRFSNLEHAYHLMVENNIRVPKLYKIGTHGDTAFAVMECLEGDTHLSQVMTGDEMGKLHRITRYYQGWIAMEEPYNRSWKDSFFLVLRKKIEESASVSLMVKNAASDIKNFIDSYEMNWQDPTHFVLSHTDGFQGMARHGRNKDEFTGIIDIEDHQFTDQRFVLAGYELLSELWGKKVVSKNFWIKYENHKKREETYLTLRPLFQIFYILNWLPEYYDKQVSEPNSSMEETIKNAEDFIVSRILKQ